MRFLVGADVGVMRSNAVEETVEPNLDERPLPCQYLFSERRDETRVR